jgi:transcriptional regulator with XRE-family HTH domain
VGEQYDGPTLRSVRESVGVPLRRVARLAGMSHGHLSKVERGEHGRPVTPAILAAYEKATGVRLADAKIIGFGDGSADTSGAGWRRGRLSDARRRGFNAIVAAVAVGGPVGEPIARMIDAIGRPVAPQRVGEGDVMLVEHAAQLATAEDLRAGGGLVSQLARVVLRWAVGLTTASMSAEVNVRLHVAIGHLAARAGWAAFDSDAHDAARNLFTVALDAAIQAGDRDLRAHVLADVAAQHNHLGYPDDCLEMVSLVEGDQRISPAMRMVLFGVKARAHAAAAEVDACRRHVDLVEDCYAKATEERDTRGWLGSVCTEAHLFATTGHAAATLARRTGTETDREQARRRLTRAVELLDPASHTRARALCEARLAMLHLACDEHDAGVDWARRALAAMPRVRSARLVRHLQAIGTTASGHADADSPVLKELVADIDAATGPTGPGAGGMMSNRGPVADAHWPR